MFAVLPADVENFVKFYRYVSEDNYAEFIIKPM
jgi:hypothetical protein